MSAFSDDPGEPGGMQSQRNPAASIFLGLSFTSNLVKQKIQVVKKKSKNVLLSRMTKFICPFET